MPCTPQHLPHSCCLALYCTRQLKYTSWLSGLINGQGYVHQTEYKGLTFIRNFISGTSCTAILKALCYCFYYTLFLSEGLPQRLKARGKKALCFHSRTVDLKVLVLIYPPMRKVGGRGTQEKENLMEDSAVRITFSYVEVRVKPIAYAIQHSQSCPQIRWFCGVNIMSGNGDSIQSRRTTSFIMFYSLWVHTDQHGTHRHL